VVSTWQVHSAQGSGVNARSVGHAVVKMSVAYIKMGSMSENPRARKLADRIKEIVASMLDTKIKDPRLGFVTITDVRVTGDLQNASIFYTVLGDETARQRTAAALESCKGLLRSEVGKQTGVRLTPTLDFHLDSVPETAQQITDAIQEAQRRDAEVDALRVGKQYAGDPDPYRKPAAHDEDDDMPHLHHGGFELVDHDENIDAPDEYHELEDFDSLTDHEHVHEAKVDGPVDIDDIDGGVHV